MIGDLGPVAEEMDLGKYEYAGRGR